MLAADEASARVAILTQLDKEYENKIREFAPLGATVAALEREVKVAENEYLQSLNALNTNKQKQQNLRMSRNLKLVDAPVYPTKADDDKRMMVVAGSFVAGLSLICGFLVALWLMNEKIRTPERAEKLTGLDVAGIFPFVPEKSRTYDFQYLENSLGDQIISSIILNTKEKGSVSPVVITGIRAGEGKVWAAAKIACKLAKVNDKVLFLYPNTEKLEVQSFLERCEGLEKLKTKEYSMKEDFIENARYENMVTDMENFKYVVTVVPAISESMVPVHLLEESHLSLVVLNANRKWTDSDSYLLKLLKNSSGNKPKVVLNKVSEEDIKDVFGALPVKNKKKDKAGKTEPKIKISKAS
jgi:hypothetical protein